MEQCSEKSRFKSNEHCHRGEGDSEDINTRCHSDDMNAIFRKEGEAKKGLFEVLMTKG